MFRKSEKFSLTFLLQSYQWSEMENFKLVRNDPWKKKNIHIVSIKKPNLL